MPAPYTSINVTVKNGQVTMSQESFRKLIALIPDRTPEISTQLILKPKAKPAGAKKGRPKKAPEAK